MDPSVHADKPAKDDMGMDYIPVYADDAQGASSVPGRAAVTIAPDRAQLLGIRSEPVTAGVSGGTLRTVGRVAVDERRREVVQTKFEGYVEKLYVNFTGELVRRGQPLLAIYSPELVAAQKEYLVAPARRRLGESGVPGVAKGGAELAERPASVCAHWTSARRSRCARAVGTSAARSPAPPCRAGGREDGFQG
jgi:hypothetical protein